MAISVSPLVICGFSFLPFFLGVSSALRSSFFLVRRRFGVLVFFRMVFSALGCSVSVSAVRGVLLFRFWGFCILFAWRCLVFPIVSFSGIFLDLRPFPFSLVSGILAFVGLGRTRPCLDLDLSLLKIDYVVGLIGALLLALGGVTLPRLSGIVITPSRPSLVHLVISFIFFLL